MATSLLEPEQTALGFCRDCDHWTAIPGAIDLEQGKCMNGETRRSGSSCQWFKQESPSISSSVPEVALVVGQVISFTFDTPGRSSGTKHRNYASGVIEKAGKRLSVRVLEDLTKHVWWREEHVGKIKVISPQRVIPELKD